MTHYTVALGFAAWAIAGLMWYMAYTAKTRREWRVYVTLMLICALVAGSTELVTAFVPFNE